MSEASVQILNQALELDEKDRVWLVEELTSSLAPLQMTDEETLAEVTKRKEEMLSNPEASVSMDEMMARLRKEF